MFFHSLFSNIFFMKFYLKNLKQFFFPSKHLKHRNHLKPPQTSGLHVRKLFFPSKHSQKLIELFFPSKHSETVTNLKQHTVSNFLDLLIFSCDQPGFILLRFLFYSIRIHNFRLYISYALKLHKN